MKEERIKKRIKEFKKMRESSLNDLCHRLWNISYRQYIEHIKNNPDPEIDLAMKRHWVEEDERYYEQRIRALEMQLEDPIHGDTEEL